MMFEEVGFLQKYRYIPMGLCSQQLKIACVYYSTAITDKGLPTEDLMFEKHQF